jgi:TRAP-type uncharacterized transport system fused permease subunit
MDTDREHPRLLSIFHYVVGGLTALFGCFPCIHLAIGIAFVSGAFPEPGRGQEMPPAFLGWIFIAVGASLIIFFWTIAIMTILGGRFLARQRHYMYCFVVAVIECLMMPFGTVLGVFTIIVLIRPSVKSLFEAQ